MPWTCSMGIALPRQQWSNDDFTCIIRINLHMQAFTQSTRTGCAAVAASAGRSRRVCREHLTAAGRQAYFALYIELRLKTPVLMPAGFAAAGLLVGVGSAGLAALSGTALYRLSVRPPKRDGAGAPAI